GNGGNGGRGGDGGFGGCGGPGAGGPSIGAWILGGGRIDADQTSQVSAGTSGTGAETCQQQAANGLERDIYEQ
ncbi:MAG: hypothetical protein ACON3Z_15205, partial [Bradymonadia bacterium]